MSARPPLLSRPAPAPDAGGTASGGRAGGDVWVARPRPTPPADDRPRVLIADDDGVTGRVLRHRFERDGLAVEIVADGIDALASLAAFPPTVALINVALAGVDGFEVLRRVRAGDVGAPALRLALMGWAGNDALIVRGFALDADDFIVRPFSLAEVSARIRRLARRAPHAR